MNSKEMPVELITMVDKVVDLHVNLFNNKIIRCELKIKTNFNTVDTVKIIKKSLNGNVRNTVLESVTEKNTTRILENYEKVIKSTSTDGLETLIFDFLKTIWDHTNPLEKQFYFWDICEHYFKKLNKFVSSLEEDEFWTIVRSSIPVIKLEILNKNSQENSVSPKSLLDEVCECLSFPRLLREDCYQIVYNKIGNKQYEFQNFELIPLAENLGFLGEYFRLKITIKQEDTTKVLIFFTKFIPLRNTLCESMALIGFKKEEFIYKKMLPLLKEYQLEDLTNIAPKCYYTVKNSFIVLEDLSLLGFTNSEITLPVGYDWIVSAIKQLSKFHSWSILLEDKLSKKSGTDIKVGDIFSEFLIECNFNKNTADGISMCYGVRLVSEYFIGNFPDICKSLSEEDFKKKARIEAEQALDNLGRSDTFYNVICHGDMWSSNILTNSEKDCMLVDFQLTRYCPPVVDLLFLIYINTDRSFRLKNMEDLLTIYYENLKNILMEHSFCIENIMTPEEFSACVKCFKATGIFQALSYVQIMLPPPEFLSELARNPETAESFYIKDRIKYLDTFWDYKPFKTRARDLVEDLYDVFTQE